MHRYRPSFNSSFHSFLPFFSFCLCFCFGCAVCVGLIRPHVCFFSSLIDAIHGYGLVHLYLLQVFRRIIISFHLSHDVVHFLAHTVSSPFVFFSSACSLLCSGHALCCAIVGCMLTFSHTRSRALSCCWCDSWVTTGASLPVSSRNTCFMFSIFNYSTHFHCIEHVTTQ